MTHFHWINQFVNVLQIKGFVFRYFYPPSKEILIFSILGILLFFPGKIKGNAKGDLSGQVCFDLSLQFLAGIFGFLYFIREKKSRLRFCILGIPILPLPVGNKSGEFQEKNDLKISKKRKGMFWKFKFFWNKKKTIRRYIKWFKNCFFLNRIDGRIRFGFENPATTGEVYGYLQLLKTWWGRNRREIKFFPEADFQKPCFIGQIRLKMYFIPLILFFLFSLMGTHLGFSYIKPKS